MQILELKGLSIRPLCSPIHTTMVLLLLLLLFVFYPFQHWTRATITANETLNIRLHVDPKHSSHTVILKGTLFTSLLPHRCSSLDGRICLRYRECLSQCRLFDHHGGLPFVSDHFRHRKLPLLPVQGKLLLYSRPRGKNYSCQRRWQPRPHTKRRVMCSILTRKKKHCLYAMDKKTDYLVLWCSNAGRRYPPDKSISSDTSVEPRSNEGPRGWQNMFAITKFSLYRGSVP